MHFREKCFKQNLKITLRGNAFVRGGILLTARKRAIENKLGFGGTARKVFTQFNFRDI